ncbi:PREDICTED: KIF1-binding protein-like [Priapulus caudatus]|uniref:KIF-binding protein n=1 Tax=Priapulus caudatus TaxID=37621 RepID=A0ABM1DRH6_PRICU|nr:PREDICTED: KIF1-binding protein-like [Priapulus caudatus]
MARNSRQGYKGPIPACRRKSRAADDTRSGYSFFVNVRRKKSDLTERQKNAFQLADPSLADARKFYSLYDHVLDYAELTCDSSLLYKLLTFFESDFERKSKMHKRHVDTPRGVLGELTPFHYLLVCR